MNVHLLPLFSLHVAQHESKQFVDVRGGLFVRNSKVEAFNEVVGVLDDDVLHQLHVSYDETSGAKMVGAVHLLLAVLYIGFIQRFEEALSLSPDGPGRFTTKRKGSWLERNPVLLEVSEILGHIPVEPQEQAEHYEDQFYPHLRRE